MTFDSFGLDARVMAGVKAMNYLHPTPIQERGIPPVMEGRDVLGLAQTGTGKTAAFALPILQRLLQGQRGRIRALVVAPTRELAEQIHQDFKALGRGTGVRSATVYGGVGMVPQVKALKGGAEVIVACPGRLLDHLQRRNADLSALEVLVLDEADHMFDMGFLPAIRQLLRQVPRGAQRLLFSATMPDELRHLAAEVLTDPVTVEIGRSAPAETVSHALYPVDKKDKTELLEHLLREHDPRSVLVFTRTKHGAKRLAQQLDKRDHMVTSLQGNLSQNRRQKALDSFKSGDTRILVATDIAARGIDVSRVSHVINYDIPDTVEAYTHRIGRTGRAERTGEAFTFVTPDDEKMVSAIERSIGTRIERVRVDGFGRSGNGSGASAADARPARASGRPGDGRAAGRGAGSGGPARADGRANGNGNGRGDASGRAAAARGPESRGGARTGRGTGQDSGARVGQRGGARNGASDDDGSSGGGDGPRRRRRRGGRGRSRRAGASGASDRGAGDRGGNDQGDRRD